MPEIGGHLTFKGGTSLSKVYGAIARFSEDIDLSIERDYLGFGEDRDPGKGDSGKEKQRRLDELKLASQNFVRDQLLPLLRQQLEHALGASPNWSIDLDENDVDGQSVQFNYPPAVISQLSPYFAPSIKLELGARSDHFPVEHATILPYLVDAIPGVLDDYHVPVRVLAGERTFWEKATILHATAHLPESKQLQIRLSRHYYDLYQLTQHQIGEAALERFDLLERVVEHKSLFFKSAAARYELACPGTLKLIPAAARIAELRRDYQNMLPMLFDSPPDFQEILEAIAALESKINSRM
ncbi:MAG: nucleotidyl transferase AbiEii/AbiGii toxin family protein [Planctomycetaceae bacterium]